MFVHMIAVLEVTMAVMQVVHVVTVRHGLTPVVVSVRLAVVGVDVLLGVRLTVVNVIDVVAMDHSLVSVAWQVLVVLGVVMWGFRIPISAHD
jgi:hypothetical protein